MDDVGGQGVPVLGEPHTLSFVSRRHGSTFAVLQLLDRLIDGAGRNHKRGCFIRAEGTADDLNALDADCRPEYPQFFQYPL